MIKSRFDDCCPHCEMKVDIYEAFVGHDYSIDFTTECPFCDKPIAVEVHTVPEFELSKPVDRAGRFR